MVCVGGASVMKSESGEGEPVVEEDWSEGREDDCIKEEERVELFEQEERGVAGGERLVSALVVASAGPDTPPIESGAHGRQSRSRLRAQCRAKIERP